MHYTNSTIHFDSHISFDGQSPHKIPQGITRRRNQSQRQYEKALEIIKRLSQNGYGAYLAGGSVRDRIQGITPLDYDIVTNAPVEIVPTLFEKERIHAQAVGSAFPITIIDGIEVATGRGISPPPNTAAAKPSPGLTPKKYAEVASKPQAESAVSERHGFPESDLAHRDLTINSMAYDPLTDALIDPFGGQTDLRDGIIRFTGDPEQRILEDPLRMVRACRFLATLEGAFDPATLSAIRSNTDLFTQKTASERIRMEILKAMTAPRSSLFFEALHTAGLLGLIFPSLSRCIDLDGGPHHGESVFEHCMLTGDALSPKRPLLRLAGYLHDIGKYDAAIMKEGHITFPGHETLGHQAINDLKILRFSSREIAYIDSVIKTHMRPLKEDSTPKAVRRLLAFLRAHNITWQTFMRMRIADKSANLNLAKPPYTLADIKLRVKMIQRELHGKGDNAFTLKDLAMNGDDIMEILGIPRSKKVGKILETLFERVLDRPEKNHYESLKRYLLDNDANVSESDE